MTVAPPKRMLYNKLGVVEKEGRKLLSAKEITVIIPNKELEVK